jgi:hypothetical protein
VLRQFTWQRTFQTQMATYASLSVRQRLPLPHAQILPLRSSSS